MSTNNKSSSLKPKKSTTNKNRIGKSKKKQPSYFDPYVTPKSERNFLNEDLNSFWKFTPRNPLNARKNMVNISSSSPFYKHRCRTEPTYSPSSSAGNMSSILTRRESDNTAAVIEARREIEKIKTELETLINANIKTQTFYKESMSLIPPDLESLLNTAADACNTLADAAPEEYEQVKTSPSRLTPMIRSSLMIPPFDRRKIVHQPDPEEELIAEGTLIDQNRPKSRTYDPEKMREFIKQQKIRRREKLQEEECKKRQMENARKHKLEELKKKTFELVAKNLKKSSAGKSAKLLPSDINTNPSKSNAQIDNSHGVNKFLLQSRRCRARSFDHSIGDKTTTTKDKETDHKRSRSVSRENNKQSNQKIPENNHIHLKLQAEVHLLNSFNNSLRQVVAVEKSLFDVPSTSGHFNPVTIKRGCDFTPNLNVQVEEIDGSRVKINKSAPNLSLVNVNDNDDVVDDVSVCSQDLGLSNIVDGSSISTVATQSIISRQEDQFNSHPYVTISLDMVDQMIKDEDIRLEHLKAVLKLRDQALFDRIKGELALLEIRKRELREHGLTNDITAIKKKQRGLIIKLQQERHEMHRLKTAHKQAAKARKSALHQQKSIIKTQLTSTDHIPKKLRRLSHSERPSLGPVKVYRVDSKTEISETQTLSRKNSDDNSFTVTTTNSSVVTQISEKISVDSLAVQSVKQPSVQSEKLKRSLLMKEAEIDKRRVEIEELIKWQKRLKQKEAEVVELENQAVKQLHSDEKPKEEKVRVFSGAHLNKVWKAISLPDQNFDEQKKYQMSKRSLDKFYQNARKMFKEVSEEEKRSKSDYSMDFEQMNSTENEYISQKPISSSSEDLSSLQQDQDQDQDDVKSVSVSESSVKTEVNIYHKTDSIQSEFIDSLNRKIASQTDSLEPSLVEQSDSLNSKLKPHSVSPPTSELPVEQISTNKSESQLEEHIDSQISSATTEPQIEEENIDSLNSSSAKVEKKIVSWDSSIKSDSQLNERIDSLNSSATTEPQIEENVASLNSNSSIKSSVEENIVSLNSSSVKSEPLIEENVDSLNSSPKSDPETDENIVSLNSSLTKSEPQIEENVVSLNSSPKTDENIVSLSSSSAKSEPQIEEIVVSLNSSPKSEPQIEENVASLNSSTQTESQVQEIVASLNSSSTKSKSQIEENVVSEATQVEENIVSQNSSSIKLDTQIEEIVVSLNSSPKSKSDTQLEEIVASLNSSPKSEDQIEENVVSLNSSLKSDPETDENVVSLNSSPKSESRLEEIVVSPKSETVQIEENIISPNSSPKSEAVQTEENTSPKSENHLEYDWEPQIISELDTKTNTAESQTTPRSELYETDFDESLKETNVDSTNESIQSKLDETENDSDTVKVSPKDELIEDDSNNSKKGVSHIDVRKRVSEILADANANGPRGDKSPRVQDLYTTTYDIPGSSESTPESGSPTNEFSKQEKASFGAETPYVNEAEELLRKQLEIEQEIKRLERQQQNIPYLFMREIPNKPPPPYKPPDFPLTPVIASIIPSKPEQTKKIINEATDILFTAYTQGEDLTKTSSNRPDDQQRFMFDLCKEIAIETCKPTLNMERKPASWRSQKNQFQNLFAKRPHTKNSLNSVLNRKVLQLLNFEPIARNDSLIIRWSRKKRDHVDEILVSETQAEEAEWTNFDSDEDVIKDNLTQNILEMLIVDAAKDASDVLMKKKRFSWIHC